MHDGYDEAGSRGSRRGDWRYLHICPPGRAGQADGSQRDTRNMLFHHGLPGMGTSNPVRVQKIVEGGAYQVLWYLVSHALGCTDDIEPSAFGSLQDGHSRQGRLAISRQSFLGE